MGEREEDEIGVEAEEEGREWAALAEAALEEEGGVGAIVDEGEFFGAVV